MKPEVDSIGTIFFGKEQKWYIIGQNGKAKYISEAKWFEYMDEGKTINAPLYVE